MKLLKKGGNFVAKVFKLNQFNSLTFKNYSVKGDFYYDKAKLLFDNIYYYKPSCSRPTSHETFMICENYDIENEDIKEEIEKMNLEQIFNYKMLEKEKDKIKLYGFLNFLMGGEYYDDNI